MGGLTSRLLGGFPGLAYRCRHDADWTLEYASDGVQELLGYTPRELVDERVTTIADLIHPDDLSNVSLDVERAITERRTFRLKYRIRTRDGVEKWVSEVGRGDYAPDGSLLALEGFLIDITQQVLAERAVSATSRDRTVRLLASGIAHDVNNLLTGVLAISSSIQATASGALREDAADLSAAATAIAKLAKQLGALGQPMTSPTYRIDLAEIIAGTEPLLRTLVGGAITLEQRLVRGLMIHADPTRIEQAIANLVGNARDAIPERGHIVISLDRRHDHAVLAVTDDGLGMTDEVRKRMFDPFFTTKSSARGTGLGMMVVEQVAHELRAELSVTSAPGRGTRIELEIPLVERIDPASSAIATGSPVLLLVDDEPIIRGALARGLRRFGFTVLEAHDGASALRLSERHRGPIDVLVTDGQMPNMTGVELAVAFRAQRPTTERILITGDNIRAPDELFEETIVKPFDVELLADTIRKLLSS